MTVPSTLFDYVVVTWAVPSTITYPTYDTVNIYKASSESGQYALLSSTPLSVSGVLQTQFTDNTTRLASRDAYNYMVVFSHSTSGLVSGSYLAYKGMTARETRLVLQLRDSLSRFVTNRLADEEIRQYLEQGIQSINMYSPTTSFDSYTLPRMLEPLALLGGLIMGIIHNMLGIGFTDIQYSDQGFSLTTSRSDKMSQLLDKVLARYNELIAIAKLEYAEGPAGVGTVALPIGMGGNLNRGIMNVFDLLSAVGR